MVKVGRMRRANRFLLMAGLIAVVASGADASLWRRNKSNAPAATQSANAASTDPAAMTLNSIDVDGTRVVLRTSGTPAYTSYSPSPDVFVVDLTSTGKAGELAIPATMPAGVATIAAENAVEMGTRLTRVTFRLSQPMNLTASAGDNSVIVTMPFTATAAKIAATAATNNDEPIAPTQIAAKVETPAEPVSEPVAEPIVTTMNLEPAPAAASGPLPKAKKLKDVAAVGSAIRITGDGELTYRAFQLAGPDRVVVDISGVRNAVVKKNITVDDSVVKRVRIGQFSPDVIRVVLDLDSKATYDVSRQGENLVVTFGGAPAPVIASTIKAPAPEPEL